MIPEGNEEPLQGALSGKMRGLVPPQKLSREQSQVKTHSDYSIHKCDSNLRIFCQDIPSVFSSGDLGFYALSAKDYVVYCSGSSITLLSGSSVSEAFSLVFQGESATSSSNTGKEVDRARADLLMPATPVSLSSVIFSSFWALWGRATAMHINGVWIQERRGPRCPSLTSDPASPGDQPPLYYAEKQGGTEFASNSKPSFAHFLHYCKTELGKYLPIKASLNIPDSSACKQAKSPLLGTDPSFKIESAPQKKSALCTSATCNQYASFPTSKNQAAGKLDKYGFAASFPQMLKNRWGIPCGFGLLGGGESAANGWGSTAIQKTSAWGTSGTNQSSSQSHWGSGNGGPSRSSGPPNSDTPQTSNMKQNAQNNPPQMPNSVNSTNSSGAVNKPGPSNGQQQQQQQPPPSQQQPPPASQQQVNASQNSSGSSSNSWTQAASKGLPSGNASSDAQKLQNIKEALLSREGWGGENVNQDTRWEVTASPEPGKDAPTPHWKINNGCDLWENNLRNGGAAPPKPQQAPWGPDPRTHFGGTWGEEDEPADSSNAWVGPSNQPQWGNSANPPNMWGAPPKKPPEWGAPNSAWGEQGPPRTIEGGTGDWASVPKPSSHIGPHPNNQSAPHPGAHPGPHPGAQHPGNHSGPQHPNHPSGHPPAHSSHPQHHAAPHLPHPTAPHPGSHPPSHPSTHPTHPPSHTAPHVPPHVGSHVSPHVAPGHVASHMQPHVTPHIGAQWNGNGKDKPTGWEEPSPPPARRDDGTEFWGNPSQQQANISRWKDLPNPNVMARPGMGGAQQTRISGPPLPNPVKDQRMWGQARSGSWEESPHDTGNTVWGDPSITSTSWISKQKLPQGGVPGSWPDSELDLPGWNNPNSQKKEDIEAAVRNSMGMEDSLMDLASRASAVPGNDAWRTPVMDDHPTSAFTDHNPSFQHPRFPPHLQLPINPPLQATWQHIQIAVQAGYLNPQILNQSLTPTTLVMLRTMLTHILNLHKLTQQMNLLHSQGGQNRGSTQQHLLQLNIRIKEIKQQIQQLSAQIAAQQNTYNKQHPPPHQQPQQQQVQQPQQQQVQPQPQPSHQAAHLNPHLSSTIAGATSQVTNSHSDILKSSLPETFLTNFGDMAINSVGQGSKLGQWKTPPPDNDSMIIGSGFVRAPGKPSFPQTQQTTNIAPLLPPQSNTWTFPTRNSDSDWPVSSSGMPEGSSPSAVGDKVSVPGLDSWPNPQPGQPSYGLDIKPFEPGKTWLQVKNEDDPNVTPGSVTKSPLSIGIKLTSIPKSSTSNSMSDLGSSDPLSTLSLNSNAWSPNPSTGQQSSSSPNSSESKLCGSTSSNKSTWSDNSQTQLTGELWGPAPGTKSRGPPPGMSANGNHQQGLGGSGNSWGIGRSTSWSGDQQRNPSNSALHPAGSQPWSSQIPSNWLILKNLTPQIDGSTLKTLCLQHGPLVKFHLVLNHGFALVNYGTREEAIKAQGNLNNCILSNTTIQAEFALDADVNQLLGTGTPTTPSATWGGSGQVSTPTSQTSSSKFESWSPTGSLWSSVPSGGSSLWGTPSLSGEGDQHRATPSSYLPEGLLTSDPL